MRVLNDGKPRAKNLNEQMAAERIIDCMIVMELGWTFDDIANCPDDFYSDLCQIMEMRKGVQEVKSKMNAHKKK